MPSSLIFAALATAWLVVLVPMIAKRRQEVVRVAESALASRVLHRPNTYRSALRYDQEVSVMGEQIAERELDERRYRPGRGGYDPEAAALAARERYVFRQRIVLGLLASAIATLLLGLLASSVFLGMHVMLDLALVGYLAYLRRQVRIEEEVRQRRAAPAADESAEEESHHEQPHHEQPRYERVRHEEPPDAEPLPEQPPVRYGGPPPRAHPTAVALDLDDEDPMFDELDPAFEPRYRRAAGE